MKIFQVQKKVFTPYSTSLPCVRRDSAGALCLGRLGCADLAHDLPVLIVSEERL